MDLRAAFVRSEMPKLIGLAIAKEADAHFVTIRAAEASK
jgi:hypothetical protein